MNGCGNPRPPPPDSLAPCDTPTRKRTLLRRSGPRRAQPPRLNDERHPQADRQQDAAAQQQGRRSNCMQVSCRRAGTHVRGCTHLSTRGRLADGRARQAAGRRAGPKKLSRLLEPARSGPPPPRISCALETKRESRRASRPDAGGARPTCPPCPQTHGLPPGSRGSCALF